MCSANPPRPLANGCLDANKSQMVLLIPERGAPAGLNKLVCAANAGLRPKCWRTGGREECFSAFRDFKTGFWRLSEAL